MLCPKLGSYLRQASWHAVRVFWCSLWICKSALSQNILSNPLTCQFACLGDFSLLYWLVFLLSFSCALLLCSLWHNAAGNVSKLFFRLTEAQYLPCEFSHCAQRYPPVQWPSEWLREMKEGFCLHALLCWNEGIPAAFRQQDWGENQITHCE